MSLRKERIGESGKRRRPIALKADLDITKSNVADTLNSQGRKTRQKKKAGDSDKRRRPIALNADLNITESSVPNKKKTQGEKTRYSKKTIEPRIKIKVPAEANTCADTQAFYDTHAPVRLPQGVPSANLSELCFSWVKRRRRLLLVVGLSFISGILFRSWFAPDEPAAPNQVTYSGQAAQKSVLDRTDNGPQSAPNPGIVADSNTLPSHAINGYPPKHQVYRNTSNGNTWLQQAPSSQNPNYEWREYGHQTTQQTPSSLSWRDPGGQATPGYQKPTRQRYTPWIYNFQQYPSE